MAGKNTKAARDLVASKKSLKGARARSRNIKADYEAKLKALRKKVREAGSQAGVKDLVPTAAGGAVGGAAAIVVARTAEKRGNPDGTTMEKIMAKLGDRRVAGAVVAGGAAGAALLIGKGSGNAKRKATMMRIAHGVSAGAAAVAAAQMTNDAYDKAAAGDPAPVEGWNRQRQRQPRAVGALSDARYQQIVRAAAVRRRALPVQAVRQAPMARRRVDTGR